jgi:glycosyltransferase involved in cell wall biosynthesis
MTPPQSSLERIRELHIRAEAAGHAGQWFEAAQLLERCLRLARFGFRDLNSQWMVAADRGMNDPGGSALSLAESALGAGAPDAALAFLQYALYKGANDESTRRLVESRAIDLVLNLRGTPPAAPSRRGKDASETLRVGHLLGCVNPTHAPTRLVKFLTSRLPPGIATSFVYTSEWASGWYRNWTTERQSGPPELFQEFGGAPVHVEAASGGFTDRARRLAERIEADGLDLLVVHASGVELVTCLVAALRPARILVNVNHASEMPLPVFDGVVHMFRNGLERTVLPGIPSVVIPPASDCADPGPSAPHVSRDSIGLPQGATVSGTFGNLYKVQTAAYTESLVSVLRRHPGHHHIIAGGGDEARVRATFEAAGVGARVHLLGRRTDIPSLLRLLDFYLASHPYPGALSEIEAMAAGCPVISVRDDPKSHYNSGAEVVGIEECIVLPGDVGSLVALATRYLEDPAFRAEAAGRLRQRYNACFRPETVVAAHLEFYLRLSGR